MFQYQERYIDYYVWNILYYWQTKENTTATLMKENTTATLMKEKPTATLMKEKPTATLMKEKPTATLMKKKLRLGWDKELINQRRILQVISLLLHCKMFSGVCVSQCTCICLCLSVCLCVCQSGHSVYSLAHLSFFDQHFSVAVIIIVVV